MFIMVTFIGIQSLLALGLISIPRIQAINTFLIGSQTNTIMPFLYVFSGTIYSLMALAKTIKPVQNGVKLDNGEVIRMVLLTREQLEDRLAALNRASLELVSDLSLETVLERIVKLARVQANARYAALGVVDEQGELDQFIPIGMTESERAAMSHPPQGRGLLGLLGEIQHPIRVPEISADSRSVGFPPNHPKMHSFLGVPITLGDTLLGQLYLTDKLDYPEFTDQDERVIETLAAYAAVAITNARLVEKLLYRDQQLSRRNEDLRLLNDVAAALTRLRGVAPAASAAKEHDK